MEFIDQLIDYPINCASLSSNNVCSLCSIVAVRCGLSLCPVRFLIVVICGFCLVLCSSYWGKGSRLLYFFFRLRLVYCLV